MNNTPDREFDNTHEQESKYIDIVAIICRLVEYIKDCQITECNEIINNDYRGFLIDLDLVEYF